MSNRRSFLQSALALGAGGYLLPRAAKPAATTAMPAAGHASQPAVAYPDGRKLPWKLENGVKVFQLVAEPVRQELIPGKTLDLWGYNGSAPGPMIEIVEGDRVRIIFENHLPEPTAIHWHGLEVPNDMDGMPGITQPYILPGQRFIYEFTLRQNGTYFYHSHLAMQEMLGMIGPFIIHPRASYRPTVDQDFAIVLQEYAALPNNPVPNTMSMEYNWLTMNGKSAPATTPLVLRLGQRARVRLINLGMDGHPMHLHGMQFWITGTEGGRQPVSNWIRRNTVWVAVAQAYDIEFEANNPGEWMLHCHLPHHMMNQMASTVGPMTETHGLPVGVNMPESMGMAMEGPALSKEYGASLGRGMGLSSRLMAPEGNGAMHEMHGMQGLHGMRGVHSMGLKKAIAPDANQVPGFPQDAFMENPAMNMDKAVAKPETYGLPPGWSGFMGGMMTLVRVLDEAMYDKIQALKLAEGRSA